MSEKIYFCGGCKQIHFDEDFNDEQDIEIQEWDSFFNSVMDIQGRMQYDCGHEKGGTIFLEDNRVSVVDFMEWDSGDKSKCWECWRKEKNEAKKEL